MCQFKEAIEAAIYPVLEVTLGDQSHGTSLPAVIIG